MASKKRGFRIRSGRSGYNRPLKQGEDYPYEIIKHNFRTYEGSKTVDIVNGQSTAENAVRYFDDRLTAKEREDGWSHFLQWTTRKPWPHANERRVNLKPDSFRKR